MNLFRNKHVLTAMIIAPLLAIGAYYLVGLAVEEKPRPAVAGAAYPLIAQSNCRYTSGQCDLKNTEFIAKITIDSASDASVLHLTSQHALQGVMIHFLEEGSSDSRPFAMHPVSDDNKLWRAQFTERASKDTVVRLAMSVNNAHYYAETTLGFGQYKTSFNKDFRQ